LDLHEAIRQRHRRDDHNVHQERYDNHALIEPNQCVVFLETVLYQICLHYANEAIVQESVQDKIESLLCTIPYVVDVNPPSGCQWLSNQISFLKLLTSR
jgi:hypothetical protein